MLNKIDEKVQRSMSDNKVTCLSVYEIKKNQTSNNSNIQHALLLLFFI